MEVPTDASQGDADRTTNVATGAATEPRAEPVTSDERRTAAFVGLLSDPNFCKTLQTLISSVATGLDEHGKRTKELKLRELEQNAERISEARERASRFQRTVMIVYALLAALTLAVIVYLARENVLSESALVPLLAGVVGSLFVKPQGRE